MAEAQILAGRLAQDKTRASTLRAVPQSLAKAEEQMALGNYGAAIFFALKAAGHRDAVDARKPRADRRGAPHGLDPAGLAALLYAVAHRRPHLARWPCACA